MKDLLIVGAGGHGKVVLDVALSSRRFEQICFLDDQKVGEHVLSYEVIGKVSDSSMLRKKFNIAVVAIGNHSIRLQIINSLLTQGYEMSPIIHPNAVVSPYCEIGAGSVVMAQAVINPGAKLGKGVIVNTGAIIEHDCQIGDGVHLSPRATLGGTVMIGEQSWICIGATVINNIHIGEHVVVAAGAAVNRDVPDHTMVAGVPAQIKRRTSE